MVPRNNAVLSDIQIQLLAVTVTVGELNHTVNLNICIQLNSEK